MSLDKSFFKSTFSDLISAGVFFSINNQILKCCTNTLHSRVKFKAKESEIVQLKLQFIKLYPDIPVFLEYHEPYYRIRVGNCRTKLEALKIKNRINKDFPGSYPVPEIINFGNLKK